VVLGEDKDREVVQPDLIFVRRERAHIVVKEEIRGAPDLVVEIVSLGTKERDRGYKKSAVRALRRARVIGSSIRIKAS
jgi:Uma2 family endonuclease